METFCMEEGSEWSLWVVTDFWGEASVLRKQGCVCLCVSVFVCVCMYTCMCVHAGGRALLGRVMQGLVSLGKDDVLGPKVVGTL